MLQTGLAATLSRIVGFRNVLVHGDDDVDLEIVRDILGRRLGDWRRFPASFVARSGV